MHDNGRVGVNKGQKISGLYLPIHLLYIFCYFCSQIFDHIRCSHTTLIIFTWSSTIFIKLTIFSHIISVNIIQVNQPMSSLGHFRMFSHSLIENVDPGYFFNLTKTSKKQNIYFISQRLAIMILHKKVINNIHYLFLFLYYHLIPHIWNMHHNTLYR